jgi:hypothetical protein
VLQYPKELRDMLLRCCEDELLGLPQKPAVPRENPSRSQGPSSAPPAITFRAMKLTDASKQLPRMLCPTARGTPTSNSPEGEGEDTAQLSPPHTSHFGLDVHGLLFFGHSFAWGAADGA